MTGVEINIAERTDKLYQVTIDIAAQDGKCAERNELPPLTWNEAYRLRQCVLEQSRYTRDEFEVILRDILRAHGICGGAATIRFNIRRNEFGEFVVSQTFPDSNKVNHDRDYFGNCETDAIMTCVTMVRYAKRDGYTIEIAGKYASKVKMRILERMGI